MVCLWGGAERERDRRKAAGLNNLSTLGPVALNYCLDYMQQRGRLETCPQEHTGGREDIPGQEQWTPLQGPLELRAPLQGLWSWWDLRNCWGCRRCWLCSCLGRRCCGPWSCWFIPPLSDLALCSSSPSRRSFSGTTSAGGIELGDTGDLERVAHEPLHGSIQETPHGITQGTIMALTKI